MRHPLIIMALEAESDGALEAAGLEVIYSGVGKVNAAYTLTKAICEKRARGEDVSCVLNLGTAGSHKHPRGTLLSADRFVQRDMDVTGLGFPCGETPFDPHPALMRFERFFPHLPSGICATGDSFLQSECGMVCDVIDMEAFAYAKVCYFERIPFASVKYVTDGADGAAHLDWKENTILAAAKFVELLQQSEVTLRNYA